jgi:peptidyl-prolyl cis-trans isomerase SurA
VRAGEDFAAVARDLSQDKSASLGGDIGMVRLSDLAPSLRAVAQALPPGGVSPILESPGDFVLLKRER